MAFKNFKCHEKGAIDFSNNKFILLTGDNGKGKTSYIDALTWVLYDETTKGNKADSVVRKKSKKNCCVILRFQINEDLYEVRKYRKDKKYGNSKFIYKNGNNITPATVKETTDLIEKIILPKDVFLNCLLFSQYIKTSFLDQGHGSQKEILDKLLSYDSFAEYRKSTIEKINTLEKNQISTSNKIDSLNNLNEYIRNTFNTDKENIEYKLKNKLEELNNHKNILNIIIDDIKKVNRGAIEKSITDISNKINNIETIIAGLDNSISNSRESYKKELEIIKTNIEIEKKNSINEIKINYEQTTNKLKSKLQLILNRINAIKQEVVNFNHKIELDTKDIINKITQDIHEKELLKTNILNNISSLNTSTTNKIDNYEEESKDILKKLESFKELENDMCPTCNNPIANKQTIEKIKSDRSLLLERLEFLNKSKIELQINLEKQMADLKLEEKIIDDEIKSLKKESSKNTKTNLKNINDDEEYTKLLLDKQSLEDQIDSIDKSVKEELNNKNNKYSKLLEEKTNELKNKYIELTKENITEKTNSENLLKDLQSYILEKENIKKNIDDKINKKYNIETSIIEKENIIKELKDEIIKKQETLINNTKNNEKQLKDLTEEMKTISDEIRILEFWKVAFGDQGIKSILLDEAIPVLNKKSLELSRLTNNIRVRFDSQRSTSSGDLRNKFSIVASNVSNLSELSELSAGETRLANIIVLLSLRHLLETMNNVNINLLLLDEILDSLDETNASVAVNMIKEISKDKCVLLITHTLKTWITADMELVL